MATNTRDQLLSSMTGKAVTWGWGAITAFSRSRLNRLLEQQFINDYGSASYLPAFSAEFKVEPTYNHVKIEKMILGKPLLSFENASLDYSIAKLTMAIVGGNYSEVREEPGEADILQSRIHIKETHSFKIEATINLSVTRGDIDRVGRVTLDLSDGVALTCNLSSSTLANEQLSASLMEYFKGLPANKRVFQLGVLSLRGYNPLTPVKFFIRTQKSPGADVRGAANEGDGAVLVFIDLASSLGGNAYPGDGSGFPYFIPDDKLSDGQDEYSAALVVNHSMLPDATDQNMALLKTLLFPGQNHFVDSSTHDPYDRIVFGNLNPKSTLYSVEPTFATIGAGQEQIFKLVNTLGEEVVNATWTSRSLNSYGPAGAGSMDGKTYTAPTRTTIGHDTLRVVVTAAYKDGEQEFQASAVLLVSYEDASISPLIAVRTLDAEAMDILGGPKKRDYTKQWRDATPIILTASGSPTDNIEWTLLDGKLGTLQGTGNTATFTLPDPSTMPDTGLINQRVRAHNLTTNQVVYSSLLLSSWRHGINISPAFAEGIEPLGKVKLTTDFSVPGTVTWDIVSGDGSVDKDGEFTASASPEPQHNVVLYTWARGDDTITGYSVIETCGFASEPHWTQLQMTVNVLDGQNGNDTKGIAYANGWQQIHLSVQLSADGGTGSLSEQEKDSLKVVDTQSGQELLLVSGDHFGLPADSTNKWAFAKQRNTFDFYGRQSSSTPPEKALTTKADDSVDLYVVTRAVDSLGRATTFHVRLVDDNYMSHDSLIPGDPAAGKVLLVPEPLPTYTLANYTFDKKRVWTQEGGILDPETGDWSYDYNYQTIDYYTLYAPGALFKYMNFELASPDLGRADINTSTIQWESDMLDEYMFSYTGYAFYPSTGIGGIEAMPEFLEFDPQLLALDKKLGSALTELQLVDGYRPSPGQLVISMHRTDDIKYVVRSDLKRKHLDKSVRFSLQDVNGNIHNLAVSFDSPTNPDSRNKLLLEVASVGDALSGVIKS